MTIYNKFIVKNYNLKKEIDLFFSIKKSLLYIKGLYSYIIIKMPNYYYYIKENNNMKILYNKKMLFTAIIKNIFILYDKLLFLYSVRLKLRGLGFRIRKVSKNLYYFFFNYINMYYFYVPKNLLIKWYKKRLLLISNDFKLLKLIFAQILLLKKIGVYKLIGIRFPRQIILIKKGGKKI